MGNLKSDVSEFIYEIETNSDFENKLTVSKRGIN